jgi:uncharacterized OB-fold protein
MEQEESDVEYEFERVKITGGIGADDPYWRGLEQGRFTLPRCSGCGKWMWPANFRCGQCGSWDSEWVERAAVGTIYSWTRSWYAFDRVRERAEDVPYVTVLTEIEDAGGARVLGVLEGGESGLRVGARVRGRILPPSAKAKGYPSVVWVLEDAA